MRGLGARSSIHSFTQRFPFEATDKTSHQNTRLGRLSHHAACSTWRALGYASSAVRGATAPAAATASRCPPAARLRSAQAACGG